MTNTHLPDVGDPRESAGLRFSCSRCSACCRFDTGYVWLSRADLDNLCVGLDLPEATVIERYCRVVDMGIVKRLSLTEQVNMDCIFWQNGACVVYEHRPLQCLSFPFWSGFTTDRTTWHNAASGCPGIGIGKLYSTEEIERWLSERLENPPLNVDSVDETGRITLT